MSKHTPGPWHAELGLDPEWVVRSDKNLVCKTLQANDKANARLIAAAPELLGALRLAFELHDARIYGQLNPHFIKAARRAIAKAKE